MDLKNENGLLQQKDPKVQKADLEIGVQCGVICIYACSHMKIDQY